MTYKHITKEGKVIELQNSTKNVLDHVTTKNKKRKDNLERDNKEQIGERTEEQLWRMNKDTNRSPSISIPRHPLFAKN